MTRRSTVVLSSDVTDASSASDSEMDVVQEDAHQRYVRENPLPAHQSSRSSQSSGLSIRRNLRSTTTVQRNNNNNVNARTLPRSGYSTRSRPKGAEIDSTDLFKRFTKELIDNNIHHKAFGAYAIFRNPLSKVTNPAKWFMNHINKPRAPPGPSRNIFIHEVQRFMDKPRAGKRAIVSTIKERHS